MSFALLLAHVVPAALWLGSMGYSLFVVQPRLPRVLRDPARVEDVYRELAAGNRWRVVGLIGVIGLSGFALAAIAADRTAWWWTAVAAKAALWLGAAALFWWVSWRGWPRRVFALADELPGVQRRFRAVALTLLAVVGAAFVLGLALHG